MSLTKTPIAISLAIALLTVLSLISVTPVVASPQWIGLQSLLPSQSDSASNPAVAVNDLGRTVSVWNYSVDGSTFGLKASFREPAGEWSSPITVTDSKQINSQPRAALSRQGVATILWQDGNGGDQSIEAVELDQSGPVVSRQTLSRNSTPNSLQIASDGGEVHATWIERNGVTQLLKYSSLRHMGDWSEADTFDTCSGIRADISASQSGHLALAWLCSTSTGDRVWTKERSDDGTWSPREQLSSSRSATSVAVRVSDWGLLATWAEQSGDEAVVRSKSKRFEAGQVPQWSQPTTVVYYEQVIVNDVLLALNDTGQAAVAWVLKEPEQRPSLLWALRTNPESEWSESISLGPGLAAQKPQLVIDGNGVISAMWLEHEDYNSVNLVWMRKAQQRIKMSVTRQDLDDFDSYSLVSDRPGNQLAMWSKQIGDRRAVEFNVSDGAGPLIGDIEVSPERINVGDGATISTPTTVDVWSRIFGYTWSVEGRQRLGAEVEHTFQQPGAQPISLTVSDWNLNRSSRSLAVEVATGAAVPGSNTGDGGQARQPSEAVNDPQGGPAGSVQNFQPPSPTQPGTNKTLAVKLTRPQAESGRLILLSRKTFKRILLDGFQLEITGFAGARSVGASLLQQKRESVGRKRNLRRSSCHRLDVRSKARCNLARSEGIALSNDYKEGKILLRYRPLSKRLSRRVVGQLATKSGCSRYQLLVKILRTSPTGQKKVTAKYFKFYLKVC